MAGQMLAKSHSRYVAQSSPNFQGGPGASGNRREGTTST
jgi:hypothetical protein